MAGMSPFESDPKTPQDSAALNADQPTHAKGSSEQSEQWLRAAVQNSSDIVMIFEADATIRYVSRAAKRVLGYRSDDLIGTRFLDYIHPEDLEYISKSFTETVEKPGVQPPRECRIRAADGSWRRMEAVGSNWLDDPNVGGVVANVRDVTERKEVEERYQSLVQNALDVIVILGADGTTQYASPSIKRVLGYEPEKLIGDNGLALIHPGDIERSYALLAQVLSSSGAEVKTELRLQHADGSWCYVEVAGKNLIDHPSIGGIVVNYHDINERKAFEEQLEHQAFHDDLTDLPNRQLFVDCLEQALRRTSRRTGRKKVAVLFMDLDNFKVVNDSLGHEIGDHLLVAVGERIRESLRPEDTLARLGGDEFTVLVENVEEPADAVRVAERIIEAHREPFGLGGQELFIKPSIGIALGTVHTTSPKDLLRNADTAMYRAKKGGLGYRVFEQVM
jgi:diguanylate cyclase (GGDEF)-like protein/PAS domain S-box-containing protein